MLPVERVRGIVTLRGPKVDSFQFSMHADGGASGASPSLVARLPLTSGTCRFDGT